MSESTAPSRAYERITEQIIAALERGTVPWRRPWRSLAGGNAPRNALSDRAYRGINPIVLGLTAELSGYADPRWITYRQAQLRGGHVRKGEKASPVVFWRWIERPDPDDAERVRRFPVLRLYSVFNVEQCADLDLAEPPAVVDIFNPTERAETIIGDYQGAPSIQHNGGERAFYRPSRDSIHMPPRAAFESADAYYAITFHECAHSTGHPSRLDRKTLTDAAPFGSPTYSREELVAEFGAAFLSAEAGIDPSHVERSASYVASWLRALRDDARMVVIAAAQGQKAAEWVLGRSDAAASMGVAA